MIAAIENFFKGMLGLREVIGKVCVSMKHIRNQETVPCCCSVKLEGKKLIYYVFICKIKVTITNLGCSE